MNVYKKWMPTVAIDGMIAVILFVVFIVKGYSEQIDRFKYIDFTNVEFTDGNVDVLNNKWIIALLCATLIFQLICNISLVMKGASSFAKKILWGLAICNAILWVMEAIILLMPIEIVNGNRVRLQISVDTFRWMIISPIVFFVKINR